MSDTYARTRTSTWRDWAGTITARPARTESPASVDELADVLRRAGADGLGEVGSRSVRATRSRRRPPPTAC
ncbi:hypothetical protein SCALM49S_04696 [Streptomyces californicus]